MSDEPQADAATRAAYEEAVDQLPPLTRLVFLCHRVDELAYGEIAGRLSITVPAVEGCLADALSMIAATVDRQPHRPQPRVVVAEAEMLLRQRHRRFTEDALREIGIAMPVPWSDTVDDDTIALQALMHAMPPAPYETFVLKMVDHLSFAQIARRKWTFKWVIMRRMLRAIRHMALLPPTFEKWLKGLAGRGA